jgi:hypothetical protein
MGIQTLTQVKVNTLLIYYCANDEENIQMNHTATTIESPELSNKHVPLVDKKPDKKSPPNHVTPKSNDQDKPTVDKSIVDPSEQISS